MNNNQLQTIDERIERLEEDKAAIAEDIKGIYSEAKSHGFDAKILRKVIALRKKAASERDSEQTMIDLYMSALGMLADTPLGQAAIARDLGQ
jgi:uncharacterized protein (UPF0335 family)